MSSDIVERLKNDSEFIKKVAEALSTNAILSQLGVIERKVDYLMDIDKLVWEKFSENDKKFNALLEEIHKLREDLIKEDMRHNQEMEKMRQDFDEKMQKEDMRHNQEMEKMRQDFDEKMQKEDMRHNQEMEKMRQDFDEKMQKFRTDIRKDVKVIKKTLENLSISIEDEAIEFLAYKLRKDYNIDVNVISLNIQKVVEIDIFAELSDSIVVGEVKVRAGIKAIKQLEDSITKLMKVRPELGKKKIIRMIYAKKMTPDLIEECRKRGVYLTNGISDLTHLVL
ncbi:DNA repair protein [Candidatus Acidianus copahuensis]|uniref:DNA repair protein n=1 Tax=Candidatus Acidianus copahuensis TaxID=1160895 RepID=A0A031LR96_9CREN|nr:hypothetical protein [Candidatus Acidianus copahuensis]EZQ10009.1 DNA repair protein [Candidatus Acidianus copahuensis]